MSVDRRSRRSAATVATMVEAKDGGGRSALAVANSNAGSSDGSHPSVQTVEPHLLRTV